MTVTTANHSPFFIILHKLKKQINNYTKTISQNLLNFNKNNRNADTSIAGKYNNNEAHHRVTASTETLILAAGAEAKSEKKKPF